MKLEMTKSRMERPPWPGTTPSRTRISVVTQWISRLLAVFEIAPLVHYILTTKSLALVTYQFILFSQREQINAFLVTLDVAITTQTRLNEVHEAHTGKNFKEQRHLNKDRRLRLQGTVNAANTRTARSNSHSVQIKGLLDRAHMLAEGGEWAEQKLQEAKTLEQRPQKACSGDGEVHYN
jgi:hypothetical protein